MSTRRKARPVPDQSRPRLRIVFNGHMHKLQQKCLFGWIDVQEWIEWESTPHDSATRNPYFMSYAQTAKRAKLGDIHDVARDLYGSLPNIQHDVKHT